VQQSAGNGSGAYSSARTQAAHEEGDALLTIERDETGGPFCRLAESAWSSLIVPKESRLTSWAKSSDFRIAQKSSDREEARERPSLEGQRARAGQQNGGSRTSRYSAESWARAAKAILNRTAFVLDAPRAQRSDRCRSGDTRHTRILRANCRLMFATHAR
jgi:hypothetical protein